jgi:hypothetical protein
MSLQIKIGNIEMTPEEAREIYTELKRLFDGQDNGPFVPYPYVVPASPSIPQQPWYQPQPTWGWPEITC